MDSKKNDLISFYRQWIVRLEVNGRILASCMISQQSRRQVLDLYRRRVLFLRKCIAYMQAREM